MQLKWNASRSFWSQFYSALFSCSKCADIVIFFNLQFLRNFHFPQNFHQNFPELYLAGLSRLTWRFRPLTHSYGSPFRYFTAQYLPHSAMSFDVLFVWIYEVSSLASLSFRYQINYFFLWKHPMFWIFWRIRFVNVLDQHYSTYKKIHILI